MFGSYWIVITILYAKIHVKSWNVHFHVVHLANSIIYRSNGTDSYELQKSRNGVNSGNKSLGIFYAHFYIFYTFILQQRCYTKIMVGLRFDHCKFRSCLIWHNRVNLKVLIVITIILYAKFNVHLKRAFSCCPIYKQMPYSILPHPDPINVIYTHTPSIVIHTTATPTHQISCMYMPQK